MVTNFKGHNLGLMLQDSIFSKLPILHSIHLLSQCIMDSLDDLGSRALAMVSKRSSAVISLTPKIQGSQNQRKLELKKDGSS